MTSSPASFELLTHEISGQLAVLYGDQPALKNGFNELAKASMATGALSEKTKELIALALGVAARCDGCLGFHAKALARLGASKAEVEEALAVAVHMGGGPSLMYSANAMRAFAEFSNATESIA